METNDNYSQMKHLLLTTIGAVVLVGCGEAKTPKSPTAEGPDISIHDAAKTGNIEAVKQHLAAGPVWVTRSTGAPGRLCKRPLFQVDNASPLNCMSLDSGQETLKPSSLARLCEA